MNKVSDRTFHTLSTVAQRWHAYVFIYLVRTTYYVVCTRYVSRAHEILWHNDIIKSRHNIIGKTENTKYIHECCLTLADSRNDINILLYFNAECRYFGTKVYIWWQKLFSQIPYKVEIFIYLGQYSFSGKNNLLDKYIMISFF